MKTYYKALIALAIVALSGTSFAQASARASATANAMVVCPIKIITQSNLYFGCVFSGNGTAHVTYTGNETYTGDIYAGAKSGTHAPAQFVVAGQSGFSFAITMSPASGSLIITDGNGHAASVQLDPPVAASGTLGSLCSFGGTTGGNCYGGYNNEFDEHQGDDHDGNSLGSLNNNCCGSLKFNIGGVLKINDGQLGGSYSNSNPGGTPWYQSVAYN